ncbi:hypothetical protein [Rahnella aquatilis]|uniref:Uncharacterized protein n=1 Tax=Rahnella aquatilis (strain ATCC 33071 / DSM 4594 / JCM 1683 / NBRC 105701 / NCIMB 13365 / CIP 78.65) TaxID=745277 RepID=H2J263_RAHAC|nr:hypothetical protein [Rahnella aquatilis]AEX54660.1 hypothetical protein Rahaq2_4944 [Rahnella aquatilis CIP 78.65 = ATCC 33071]
MRHVYIFSTLKIVWRLILFVAITLFLTPLNESFTHYLYLITDPVVEFYHSTLGVDSGDRWDMEELTFLIFAVTATSIIAVCSIAVIEALFKKLMRVLRGI